MIHTYQKRLHDLIGCEIHGVALRENNMVLALALSVHGAEFRIALEPADAVDAWFKLSPLPVMGFPCKVLEVACKAEAVGVDGRPDGVFKLNPFWTRGLERQCYAQNSGVASALGRFDIHTTSGQIPCIFMVTRHGNNPAATCYPLCSVVVSE